MTDHIPTIADAEHEYFEEEALPEASNLAAAIFWGLAGFALLLVPMATLPGKRDLGWFQEPWSWPVIVLCVALIGGAAQPIRLYALSKLPGFGASAKTAFEGMGRSIIYAASFLGFLGAISLLGFTLSTFLYMQILYWISGLRGGRWPWVALAVTVAIFLAFRVGLGIWFPQPPIVNFLPAWVGNNLGAYL